MKLGSKMYSPHTWGWTVRAPSRLPRPLVFPTHVGMDRFLYIKTMCQCGIPHTRGDGPKVAYPNSYLPEYSPHTWGWTGHSPSRRMSVRVFPTHVGMDRHITWSLGCLGCIPHTRGDGPTCEGKVVEVDGYSPHTWGWTANPSPKD